ncbi:MAG: hypothetical protein ACTSXL_02640 [Alphaproteobacteria bacterium]
MISPFFYEKNPPALLQSGLGFETTTKSWLRLSLGRKTLDIKAVSQSRETKTRQLTVAGTAFCRWVSQTTSLT